MMKKELMMEKEGIIVIYKERAGIGLIKFDQTIYCRFYKSNISQTNRRLLRKGDKVKFKLSTESNPLVYEARSVRLIQE